MTLKEYEIIADCIKTHLSDAMDKTDAFFINDLVIRFEKNDNEFKRMKFYEDCKLTTDIINDIINDLQTK